MKRGRGGGSIHLRAALYQTNVTLRSLGSNHKQILRVERKRLRLALDKGKKERKRQRETETETERARERVVSS